MSESKVLVLENKNFPYFWAERIAYSKPAVSHFLFNFLSYIIHPLFLSLQNKTPRLVALICKGVPFGRSVYAFPFVDKGNWSWLHHVLHTRSCRFSCGFLASCSCSNLDLWRYHDKLFECGGLDLAYANSPFVTPPYRLDWPPHRRNQLMMRAVLQSVVFWSSYESASLVYSTLLHDSLFPTDFPFII